MRGWRLHVAVTALVCCTGCGGVFFGLGAGGVNAVSGYTDGFAWGAAMGKAASEGDQSAYLFAANSQGLFYRGDGEAYCQDFLRGWRDGLAEFGLEVAADGTADGGITAPCTLAE